MKFLVNKNWDRSGTDLLDDMRKIGYRDKLECVEVRSG